MVSIAQRFQNALKAFRPGGQAKSQWFPAGGLWGTGNMPDLSVRPELAWSKFGAASAVLINSNVYACVVKIAEEMAGATWRVVDGNKATLGSSEDTRPNDRLTALFKDMQYRYDGVSPFELWAYSMLVTGENYFHIIPDRTGQIVGLDWLNPLWTTPDAPRGIIERFQYQPPYGFTFIPDELMIYSRARVNLHTDVYGYSPIMVLVGSSNIGVVQAAGKAMLAYFNNDGLPGSLISPDGTVKTEFKDNDLDYIQRTFKRNKSAAGKYRTALFPYPLNVEVFDQPDLTKWADLLRAVEPDAYRVFGVPPNVVGDTTSPYQNSEENRWNYHEKMVSRFRMLEQTINTTLIPQIYGQGSGVVFEFELTPFQHIAEQERAAAKDLFTLGVASGNEYRAALGWKEDARWNVRFDPATQSLAPLDAPIQAAPPAAPTAPALPAQAAQAAVMPDTGKEAGGLFLALKLGAQPDLIELQDNVKRISPVETEWEDPADFHITLAYAPVADEVAVQAALEAVRAIPVPTLSINPGSLRAFDVVGRHALHFRVRRNPDLLNYQASVVDALDHAGIEVSAFTRQWIPHVTMGYSPAPVKQTYSTNLMVSPKGVYAMSGDAMLWDSEKDAQQAQALKAVGELADWHAYQKAGKHVKRAFVWSEVDSDTAWLIEADYQDDPAKALAHWRKVYKARAGRTDYDYLPEPPALIKSAFDVWQEAGVTPDDAQKAARDLYEIMVSAKAVSRIQSRFEQAAFTLLRRAQLERTTRAAFERQFAALVVEYLQPAMLAGYEDGGVPDHELTPRDLGWLNSHENEQRGYVADLAAALFSDDVLTDDEIRGKPRQWWNLSVNPAYNEGLARAVKDGSAMFKRGSTSDSCRDCRTLDGKVYAMSVWYNLLGRQLVPCNRTECGGFNCRCKVIPAPGVKRTPGRPPQLRGSRKSVLEFEEGEILQ